MVMMVPYVLSHLTSCAAAPFHPSSTAITVTMASSESNKRPKLDAKANVLMVGTGEYTTGYVGGKAADSDKGAGVVALTMFDLRCRGKVDRLGMCGVNVGTGPCVLLPAASGRCVAEESSGLGTAPCTIAVWHAASGLHLPK